MRISRAMRFAVLVAGTLAESAFEPVDFNVTNALVDLGVNVDFISKLSGPVEGSSRDACRIACNALEYTFGSDSVDTPRRPSYDSFTNTYWSLQQASVDPYCIFKPSKREQVSVVVLLSRLTQCPFAVKSGGHAAFAGASSIEGGITVALERMNEITLSSDNKIASIGPGNRWQDVYTRLESQDLAVVGGRVAAIGVGGLTLGGGISFFSNQYGWACDNVASYEVVTASGIVVTASLSSSSDLYWALRGGGNNFGIVTRFDLQTIPQGKMWGGGRLLNEAAFPAAIKAFYNLGMNSAQDKDAAQILSFAYAQNTKFASADLQYAKPVANTSIFAEYMAIPAMKDTTQIRSLSNLTMQFDASNPNGLRETYWTATFKLDEAFAAFTKDVFFEEIAAIADAPSLVPAVTLQVITTPQLEKMAQNGGNPLGLDAKDGPLILLNLNMMWSLIDDDTRILETNSKILDRTVAEAEKRGLAVDYIYMNYASQYQSVVPSYGEANQDTLEQIAHHYDPIGVFQKLQPGYFKLGGAPVSSAP